MVSGFAVRFRPEADGDTVPAQPYVETLRAVFDGLDSLRNATAPVIAERLNLPSVTVKEALAFGVGPAREGSLVVPVIVGTQVPGVVLQTSERVVPSFWRYSAHVLRSIAADRQTMADVPAFAAERFAQAAHVAREAHCRVGLVQRDHRQSDEWRSLVDLTRIERGLRHYVERRYTTHTGKTRLIGRVLTLLWDPPSLVLQTDPDTKRTLTMPAALRPEAHKYWGQEVMVEVEAQITLEGEIRGSPKAIQIAPLVDADGVLADFDRSFGARRETWGTLEAEEYAKNLRRRGKSD